jgi:hypothetical protein
MHFPYFLQSRLTVVVNVSLKQGGKEFTNEGIPGQRQKFEGILCYYHFLHLWPVSAVPESNFAFLIQQIFLDVIANT